MKDKSSYFGKDTLILTILAFLYEHPTHVYEMQRLIRERRKDFATTNIRNLYHAVEQLIEHGLIESVETSREGKRPEKTIFQLTEIGRSEFKMRLKELISIPKQEYPVFTAAISFVGYLSPSEAKAALNKRVSLLKAEIASTNAYLLTLKELLPEILILEVKYTLALQQAEIDWISTIIDHIDSGDLNWDIDELSWQLDKND